MHAHFLLRSCLLSLSLLINVSYSFVYILLWDQENFKPSLPIGNKYFINRKCPSTDCYISNGEFNKIREYDAIFFNTVSINNWNSIKQYERHKEQNFVLISNQPAITNPIPKEYDSFFNVTFTYKLDSDVPWRQFVVKNTNGTVIAPSRDVTWIDLEQMEPIRYDVKEKLKNKRKAAAWFSNCESQSKREEYVLQLNFELKTYSMDVDVFARCGNSNISCGNECLDTIETDYYFYLAFEDAMSEDYVTDKVLIAVQHYAVPIVYGGADYSRFMPPESYIDATKYTPKELAKKISNIINNKKQYYQYFNWHAHYSFHRPAEGADTDDFCELCTFLGRTGYKTCLGESPQKHNNSPDVKEKIFFK